MRERQRLVWATAVMMLALASSLGVAGGTAPALAGTPLDDSRADDARRFRESSGLAADPDTIQRSLAQAAVYHHIEFGVPLTADEAAEVERKARVGREIDPAAEWAHAESPSYAGSWIDHSRGSVAVFMVKSGHAETIRDLRGRLPSSLHVEFVEARYSLAELDAVQDEVESMRDELRAAGIPLVTSSIKTPTNTVELGLEHLSAASEKFLRERFGDTISIVQDSLPRPDACPLTNCLPAKAGISVTSAQVGNACTLGFGVRVTTGTDYRGILTAGHCFRAGGGSGEGDDWRHSQSGVWDHVGDAEKQTWYNGADADVGLIDYSGDPADRNNIWTDAGTKNITNVSSTGAMQIGDFVCRVGRTSGHDCGYVIDTDESLPSELGTSVRTIDHQWVVGFDSLGGDSGGPYFYGTEAWGIHTHSLDPGDVGHPKGWYSPPSWTQVEYQNRWAIAFQYCVTDAC